MTKSTKFVAALGIAAGLGVAALPLGTFAITPDPEPLDNTNVSEDVLVQLTISEGVGIAVDANTCDATGSGALPKSTYSCTTAIGIGTNASDGMTLSVINKTTEANTSLVGENTGATIAAVDGDLGNVSGTWTSGWNLTAANGTAAGSGYIGGESTTTPGTAKGFSNKAITASNQEVYVGHEAEEANVNVTYNIATSENQAADTYKDSITYTVAVND